MVIEGTGVPWGSESGPTPQSPRQCERESWGQKGREQARLTGEGGITGGKERAGEENGEKLREMERVEISITKHCHPFSFPDKQLTCQCLGSTSRPISN